MSFHRCLILCVLLAFAGQMVASLNFQQKAIVIRDLRNAIAHHAPILHRNLARDLAYMHELTDLLSPGLARALKEQSNAESLVKLVKINTPGAKF